jgi:hypothetical protein
MSFSKHNNLETPDSGTQNWGASVNENFDLIEKGPTITSTAGTTIAVNDVVYLDTSGNFQLALADASVANRYVGFATSAMNNNADGFARTLGYESHPDWFFNAGDIVYLSGVTPGGITSIAPADLVQVGTAMATNEILIRPFGTGSLQDHGSLSGLPDDDHPQYLGSDMLRSATGLTITGTLWTDEILPESNPYINISAGLTIQAGVSIRTGVEDLQTVLSLDQGDVDESFIEFTGLAVTGGTSSLDLDTGELGAVFGKAQVKVNGVTKWIRLYDLQGIRRQKLLVKCFLS